MSIRREDYCCEPLELVENYRAAEADDFKGWDIHHKAEILPCGKFSADDLKKFYQEHPEKREDWSKHFKSIKRTESWRKNISKSLCKSLTAIDVKTREEHHFSSLAEACEFLQARVCGNISTAVKTKKPYRGFYWSRP